MEADGGTEGGDDGGERSSLDAELAKAVTSGDLAEMAVLIGRVVPRHWVLLVGVSGDTLRCYEPSAGVARSVSVESLRRGRLTGLGFPRAFAFVLPSCATRAVTA